MEGWVGLGAVIKPGPAHDRSDALPLRHQNNEDTVIS